MLAINIIKVAKENAPNNGGTNMQVIQLENDIVLLRPFKTADIEQALYAANDPVIWTYLSSDLSTTDAMSTFIKNAIHQYESGGDYRFAIIDKKSRQIVGSTSFMDISEVHKRVEIGWTWYNPSVWRTAINSNCKYLLLSYCFEVWGMHRVQIKTDHENIRSQKAIERLGATKEGVLRNHMIRKDGTQRHTVMYSITNEEWPTVKEKFGRLLQT